MAEKLCPKCSAPNRVTARFCIGCGAPLPDPPIDHSSPDEPPIASHQGQPPFLIDRYRLEQELGRGGFGAVYSAWDTHLERRCAVKENIDPSPDAARQFSREASILANLSHSNLPRVTDHFIIPDQGQYLVMDYVEGEDLESLLERTQRLALEQVIPWIEQVADALQYLHERNQPVIHRDVKPANIRITPRGRAILVDFGLVKVFDPNRLTTLGARAVTPGYAPPEQYGKGKTDARTDIYALAATLYALVTGEEPLESVQRMMGELFPTAHDLNPAISLAVSAVIDQGMALDPADRFQTAAELKRALQAAASRREAAAGFQPQPGMADGFADLPAGAAPAAAAAQPDARAGSRPGLAPRPVSRPQTSLAPVWLSLSGLAAILVVFVILAVALYLFAIKRPQAAGDITVTFEAQRTLAAGMETTTAQAALLGSLTDTHPAPTATGTSLPPLIAGLPDWSVRFSDNFTGGEIAFWLGENFSHPHFSRIVTTHTPGAYNIQLDPLGASAYWFAHNLNLRTDESFILSADVRVDPDLPETQVGLIFRLTEGSDVFYVFSVDASGKFSVRLHKDEVFTPIFPPTTIQRSANGAYRLTVHSQKEMFVFYIDETRVAEVRDDNLTTGLGGIYVETGSPEATAVTINRIQLRAP